MENAEELGANARRQRKRIQVQSEIGIDLEEEDKNADRLVLEELGDEEAASIPARATSSLDEASSIDVDHGVRLEPFNVKRELREKVFEGLTSTGSSRSSKSNRGKRQRDESSSDSGGSGSEDSADDNDPWFQSVREQGERGYSMQLPKNQDADAPLLDRAAALTKLVSYLEEEETPLNAIKRLKGGTQNAQGTKRAKHRDTGSSIVSAFDHVIELADFLISSGADVNVYSETKEQLERRIAKLKGDGLSGSSDGATQMWEYAWDVSGSSPQVYGPFPLGQMREWALAGHFASNHAAAYRRTGSQVWLSFQSGHPFS